MTQAKIALPGALILVGYGSIGRGALALIERHIDFDPQALTVIDPSPEAATLLAAKGVRHLPLALTPENLRPTLAPLMAGGTGFLVNLSVDVSSLELMEIAHQAGFLYLDTVTEPWPGFYFGGAMSEAERTNYPLRETVLALKRAHGAGPTAVSCCGANPGMVSWLLKEALLTLAGPETAPPQNRGDWAALMQRLGVKGVQVAERDSQTSARLKPIGTFINTWSVDGLLSEGYQPAELGWGSHERALPPGGHGWQTGPACAIWLDSLGVRTRVRSWCPEFGAQLGYLITHNEAISVADYYTIGSGPTPAFRPTCYYAYHPSNDTVLSLHELDGTGHLPAAKHILTADEVVSGGDELGVLLYGPERAFWYGSRLTTAEARRLAPGQTATTLQVTSGVLAAMIWAIENPRAGLVEADEMDHARCLEIQRPYLGRVEGHFTDWTPLQASLPEPGVARDPADPWQFINFLAP